LQAPRYNRAVQLGTEETCPSLHRNTKTREHGSESSEIPRRCLGHRTAGGDGVRHTRIGRAWVAVTVAAVLGVAAANDQMPVAVALIGAALVGAFLVLTVGIARTTQLRIATRRGKKREQHTPLLAAGAED